MAMIESILPFPDIVLKFDPAILLNEAYLTIWYTETGVIVSRLSHKIYVVKWFDCPEQFRDHPKSCRYRQRLDSLEG